MGFEERFSKVGRALDEAKEKVRLPGSMGEPLVDKEKIRERYDGFKAAVKERAELAWEVYQAMPKAKAAAFALGGLCAVLIVAVVVLLNAGSDDGLPSKAKANEIATMAALRAKLNAGSTGAPVKPERTR